MAFEHKLITQWYCEPLWTGVFMVWSTGGVCVCEQDDIGPTNGFVEHDGGWMQLVS